MHDGEVEDDESAATEMAEAEGLQAMQANQIDD